MSRRGKPESLPAVAAEVVAGAAPNNWPSVYSQREFCDGGGLVCYGVDLRGNYRRSAVYVDKILRGANRIATSMCAAAARIGG